MPESHIVNPDAARPLVINLSTPDVATILTLKKKSEGFKYYSAQDIARMLLRKQLDIEFKALQAQKNFPDRPLPQKLSLRKFYKKFTAFIKSLSLKKPITTT